MARLRGKDAHRGITVSAGALSILYTEVVRRCLDFSRRLQLRLQISARIERDEERVRVHLGVNEVKADPNPVARHAHEECND
jgi:hypothetical protein